MVFAVNFAEGSLKAYGATSMSGTEQNFFELCVRGNDSYSINQFIDNSDGSVTDQATGLVWQKNDSAISLSWQQALAYCDTLSLAGQEDWRLPDAKSLQSLVDYFRSPATTQSAAIDALFSVSAIKNEAGQDDYPYYWTSTTHMDTIGKGENAVYIAFGRAMGLLNNAWVDLYGAGAQRSSRKNLAPAPAAAEGGAVGAVAAPSEASRGMNFARCVRGGDVTFNPAGNPASTRPATRVDTSETVLANPTPVAGGGSDGGGGGVLPPSPEAIAACSSSTVGQACQFNILTTVVNGTCQELINDSITHLTACIASVP
jgi:hypothetical protein